MPPHTTKIGVIGTGARVKPTETARAKEEAARRKVREAAALRENLQKRRGQAQARDGKANGPGSV